MVILYTELVRFDTYKENSIYIYISIYDRYINIHDILYIHDIYIPVYTYIYIKCI